PRWRSARQAGDRASGLEDAGLDPERDDDEGAEDHRRQHGRLRAVQLHDVQGVELGIGGREQRRYDREVLGDVVREGERAQRAAVISSCLPISTTAMSLVGLESRSTMLPASLAAVVPVFMATPTSAWARAGASLTPSPVMATSLPPSCSC